VPLLDHSVSVIVVAYDTGPALLECLESARADGCGEILLVNNGRRTAELDRAASLDRVRVVPNDRNLGFGGGCNLAAAHAVGDVLVFLNPDTVVEPGAIGALATVASEPSVGIASARLRLRSDPDRLNSGGGAVHVSGLGWATGLRSPADAITDTREVAAASGAAMAMRRSLFEELGGFRDEYFLYQEDLELSWRTRLRGLDVVITPKADVLHDYEFGRNPEKFALIERNRLQFVLTSYSPRLLLLLAPVLVGYELAVVAHATRHGWLTSKLRGWSWCWRHRELLRRRRRETTALRVVADRDVAHLLTATVEDTPIPMPAYVRWVNVLVSGYWKLARRLL
jgi:GT2 family glycosyltransferase